MFQKLYRHLEELNTTVKRQEEHHSNSGQWSAKISGQLEEIKHTVQQEQQKPKSTAWRPVLAIATVLTASVICVLILVIISMKNIGGNTQAALDRSADNKQASLILFTQLKAAHERTKELETEVAHLDTLVQLQSRTIVELKKLNETTVRSFLHIRNDLQQIKNQ